RVAVQREWTDGIAQETEIGTWLARRAIPEASRVLVPHRPHRKLYELERQHRVRQLLGDHVRPDERRRDANLIAQQAADLLGFSSRLMCQAGAGFVARQYHRLERFQREVAQPWILKHRCGAQE